MMTTLRSCTCDRCVSACKRIPGIFHPLEAWKAIRAGLAPRMMRVTLSIKRRGVAEQKFQALMPYSHPASPTRSRQWTMHDCRGTWEANGRCTFLNYRDRCELHDTGLKPMECREALLCGPRGDANDRAGNAWNTFIGRAVVAEWEKQF